MDERSATTPAATGIRSRAAVIACVIAGLAVFLSFLVADFPYSETLTSILAPYRLKLTYQSQRLSPPLGAKLIDVRLFSTAAAGDEALLQSPAVTLAPTLAALVTGRPGIRLRAQLYGGSIRVTLSQRSQVTDVEFNLDALDLAQSGVLRQLGAVVNGDLSGAGTAHIAGPTLPDETAMMAIAADNLAISIVNGFPPIRVGALTGKLELADGALKLSDIVAHGDDLDFKGNGTIVLADRPEDMTINGTFYLNPTQSGRDHFGFFMKMLPHPPGPDAPYTIDGYLTSPSLN